MIAVSICNDETKALMYFAGQLSDEKLELAESHIVDCGLCCKTIAHLLKTTYQQESLEETEYLNRHLSKSSKQIHSLLKPIDLFK